MVRVVVFFVAASPGLLFRMYRGRCCWRMVADGRIKLVDVSGTEQKRPGGWELFEWATIAEAVEFARLTF